MSEIMSVYSLVKDLIQEAKKQKNIAMLEKLLDIQESLFELREENESLKRQIAELNEAEDISTDIELIEKGVLIRKSDKENGKTIYYCPSCYNDNKKLYPIVPTIGNAKQCSKCHSMFGR